MAKYDLLIRGGELIDGLGGPRRRADVAVKDGRIAAIGSELEADATETLDATGLLVTPGFVDIHTHYDGQVSWDADFLPSAWHGVTTAVMGNCGVGFAPVRPADRQRLIELMEGVEDIPGSALAEGIDFRWESFAEYMEAVDFPHTMDFVMQVPHDALRVYVMGDRAVAGEPATEADIAEMRRLLREALEAGAAGFLVTAAPGPSAVLAALSLSGLPSDRFLFAGFAPSQQGARRRWLEDLAPVPATLVIYESPRRVRELLEDMVHSLGEEREAALCRELTKKFEEVLRGSLGALAAIVAERELKGEIVVLVDRGTLSVTEETMEEALRSAMARMSLKDAAAEVAEAYGLPRRKVYQAALELEKNG